MQLFTIQMAAQISGLSTHTIRAWEKRYKALVPNRSQTGRRLYSSDEIDRLTLLSQLTQIGNSIGQIANLPDSELKALFKKLTNSKEQVQNTIKKAGLDNFTDTKSMYSNLILAVQNYKFDILSHELNKAKLVLTPKKFALELVGPLLHEVGIMVERGLMNVSQEHALSSILKFHIGHLLFKHYEKKNKSPNKIAFATPEGDLHEFGILIGAMLAVNYEHDFFYLGPNLPAVALADAVKATECNIVVVGSSAPPDMRITKQTLDEYFTELTSLLPPKVELWVGGESHFDAKGLLKKYKNTKLVSSLVLFDELLEKLV